MGVLQTEFEFVLPKGYVDENGNLHREGVMRTATAADEILPMKDPRVRQNPAYLSVIILSRVVTRLGSLSMITPAVIEALFTTDLLISKKCTTGLTRTALIQSRPNARSADINLRSRSSLWGNNRLPP